MALRNRSFRCGCEAAAIVLLVVAGCTSALKSERRFELELQVGRQYAGAVQSIAFDDSGDAWLATRERLYLVPADVQGDKPLPLLDAADGRYDQVLLAPDGGLYAKLVAGKVPAGLYTAELFLLKKPKEPIAKLRLPDFPFGFGALYLGGTGQLIVTATPLDDPEGMGGRFLYAFWSTSGQPPSTITLDGPRTAVIDAAGNALLLLGERDARAFSRKGKELWRLDGRFRKGALAANGAVALLNPDQTEAVNEVHVFRDGTVTRVRMNLPVYDLALTPDGSSGAVATEGKLFLVTPASCTSLSCEPREVSPLVGDGNDYLITDMRFVNRKTLAVGMIQRVGDSWPYVFPAAVALTVDTSSAAVAQTSKAIKLEQPATWAPYIDASFGARLFAAHTLHRAILVPLSP